MKDLSQDDVKVFVTKSAKAYGVAHERAIELIEVIAFHAQGTAIPDWLLDELKLDLARHDFLRTPEVGACLLESLDDKAHQQITALYSNTSLPVALYNRLSALPDRKGSSENLLQRSLAKALVASTDMDRTMALDFEQCQAMAARADVGGHALKLMKIGVQRSAEFRKLAVPFAKEIAKNSSGFDDWNNRTAAASVLLAAARHQGGIDLIRFVSDMAIHDRYGDVRRVVVKRLWEEFEYYGQRSDDRRQTYIVDLIYAHATRQSEEEYPRRTAIFYLGQIKERYRKFFGDDLRLAILAAQNDKVEGVRKVARAITRPAMDAELEAASRQVAMASLHRWRAATVES